ncbi:OB-fold nucleic acid binding domain-containing protein, partial [uncultured Dubosiella sp.]
MYRTKYNGTLRKENIGERVQLVGWVAKKRNFGQLCFIDLRDTTGICQLVFDEEIAPQVKDVRNEYVIEAEGVVEGRKDVNPNMPTGEIEVIVDRVKIINTAKTTPLIIADDTDALEDTRMEYRYLDLRRPIMQERLKTRAAI